MSRIKVNSPNKQVSTRNNESIQGMLSNFPVQDALHKVVIVDQLIKNIKSQTEEIQCLKSELKVYRERQGEQNKQVRRDQSNRESISQLKKTHEKQIQKYKKQQQKLLAQNETLKDALHKEQQNKILYVKEDGFLDLAKRQLQAEIKLSAIQIQKKTLQDRCKLLQSKIQKDEDKCLKSFSARVDQLVHNYESQSIRIQESNKKLKKDQDDLMKQNERLKGENSSIKSKLEQALQKLKSNQLATKLLKCIADNGQKQTDFERKVSTIKANQWEVKINQQKKYFQQGIISSIKNVFSRNKNSVIQNQSLRVTIEKYQSKNTSLEQKLRTSQQELNKMQIELKNTKSNLSSKSLELQKKMKIIQDLNKTLSVKEGLLVAGNQKCAQLENSLSLQRKKNKQAQQEIKLKKSQILSLSTMNGQLNNTIKNQKQQITKKDKQNIRLTALINDKQIQIMDLNKKLAESYKKIQALQRQIQALKRKVRQLEKIIAELNNRIQQLLAKIKQLEQRLRTIQEKNTNLNIQIKNSRERQIVSTKGFKDLSKTYNKCLIEPITYVFLNRAISVQQPKIDRVADIERDLQQIENNLRSSFRSSRFFNNSTVLNENQIDFLVQAIETYTKSTIQNSFLIYKFDTINPINFHNYIDRKQNLLLIIKLVNGYVIGGFSEYAIEKGRIEKPGSGFIFNCNIKKSYNVRSDARLPVVSYDDYFCLFGNAEIRLKSQEAKVFSNFGIAASTFDNGRDTRTKFLNIENPNDNQLDLESYEYYQITFKR